MVGEIDDTLDVRLMRTLLILLTEQSVSRTAEMLRQTQPTVSAALRRLRSLFNDPLLIREGNHLVPTERGKELKVSVARVLGDMEASFRIAPPFDSTTTRRFQVVASACVGTLLLPRAVQRVRSEAPHASLDFLQLSAGRDIATALGTGNLDLAIVTAPYQPNELHAAVLLTSDMVCVVRQSHPLARTACIDMGTYLAQAHLTSTPQPILSLGPIDGQLREMNLARRIAVTAPEFGTVPSILAQTDLMFTTDRLFAEHLATVGPFAILEAPQELEPMKFLMLWHSRQHRAPTHQWLRRVFRDSAAELQASRSPERHSWHLSSNIGAGRKPKSCDEASRL